MKLNNLLMLAATLLPLHAIASQDKATEIPKQELPKKAACTVCELLRNEHGEENVAAGAKYKGKSYYFCNSKELDEFKADPDGYLPPVLPRPLPALTLNSLDEKSVSISEFKGKVILIDFWATWCKPCVKTMPDMQKLYDQYSSKGLAVLGVSIDEKGLKAVKPFLEKRKFTYPMFLDATQQPAWQALHVKAIPAVFLVNKDGQIVKQWTGEPKKGEVEAAVVELLK